MQYPLSKGLDDALLVYAQNGEYLRPESGHPLRLLLTRFEGSMNIKWLRRIKLAAEPFMMHEEPSKYTDLQANGPARQFVVEMDVKSATHDPPRNSTGPARGSIRLAGWYGSAAGASLVSQCLWTAKRLGAMLPYKAPRLVRPPSASRRPSEGTERRPTCYAVPTTK